MTQEKMSRMVTGIVVAATLLLVVLFSVLVYQWITFGVLDRRYREAKAEADQLAAKEAELGEDLEDLGDPFWKYDLALKYDIIVEE
jgi:cell division protein FtsB